MRDSFCQSLVEHAGNPEFVFLTGDLGFSALEPLQAAMGNRFINTGVAEQNMVGVAASLAREGLLPWVYSIAPFLYARAFEQIRNDVMMHRLPVVMVGNGGGYGYGVMGATHHALEDCALMASLSMRVFVPAFKSDISAIVKTLMEGSFAAYLRLGRCEAQSMAVPPFQAWRHLLAGNGPALVTMGPLAAGLLARFSSEDPDSRPSLWLAGELPLEKIPEELADLLRRKRSLVVAEEHHSNGGLGAMLCSHLVKLGISLDSFKHLSSQGYPSGLYGSQKFHRRESGLDPEQIAQNMKDSYIG